MGMLKACSSRSVSVMRDGARVGSEAVVVVVVVVLLGASGAGAESLRDADESRRLAHGIVRGGA